MDAILDLPRISKAQILTFNCVRLYLQVTLLSEISTADGKQIAIDAWQTERPAHTSTLWPFQEEPTEDSIRTWQTLLHRAFLGCHRTPRHNPNQQTLLLVAPLGHWLPQSTWLQSKWNTFYSYSTHFLYFPQSDMTPMVYGIHKHKPRSRSRNPKFEILSADTTTTLPPSAIPVDAQVLGQAIAFPSVTRSAKEPPYKPTDDSDTESFASYVADLPAWEWELIHDASFPAAHNMEELIEHLTDNNKTLIIGSDGGAKGTSGSFGAVIATPGPSSNVAGSILVEMGGIAFGHQPSSFWAESYGQLAPLRFLVQVQSYFHLMIRCSLHFLLDNLGRLVRTEHILRKRLTSPCRCLISDYDLDLQIQASLQALPSATFRSEHIKSHQDEAITGPLPWKVQINSTCDAIATAHLTSHQHEEFPQIDWHRFSQNLAPDDLQHFCIRWVNHLLPLLKRQHKWQLEPSPLCPAQCGSEEDDEHLLNCPHPDRAALHDTLLTQLSATFNPHHVDPGLRQIIKAFLAVHNPAVDFNLEQLPHPHQTLYQQQRQLGTSSPFYGFFHKDWVILQNDYLIGQGLPHSKNQASIVISKWIHLFLTSAPRAQWTARNSFLHEDTATTSAHVQVLLRLRIQELYAQQESIPEYDRRQLFGNHTLEYRMEMPPLRQKAWIQSTRALLRHAKRKANQPPAGNHDIRSFFTPATNSKGRHSGRPPG